MVYYATVNQVFIWFTQFGVKIHAKIRDAVRSGNIATNHASCGLFHLSRGHRIRLDDLWPLVQGVR